MKVAPGVSRAFRTLLFTLLVSLTCRTDIAKATPPDDFLLVRELKTDSAKLWCVLMYTTFTGEDVASVNCTDGRFGSAIPVTGEVVDKLLSRESDGKRIFITAGDLHTAASLFSAHDNNPSNDDSNYRLLATLFRVDFNLVTLDAFSPPPRMTQLVFRPGEAANSLIRVGGWLEMLFAVLGKVSKEKAEKEVKEKVVTVARNRIIDRIGEDFDHKAEIIQKEGGLFDLKLSLDMPKPGNAVSTMRSKNFSDLTARELYDNLKVHGFEVDYE